MALPPVEFFSEALQQVKSVFAKAPPMGVFRDYETGKLVTVNAAFPGYWVPRKAPTVRRLLTRGNFNFDCELPGSDSFRLAPEPGSGLARAAPATGGRNRRRSGAAPARLLACQVRAGGEPGPTAQGTFIGCRSPTGIGCGASSLLSWEPAHVRQHRLKQEKLEKEKANATEERRKKEVAEKALEALGPKPTDGSRDGD